MSMIKVGTLDFKKYIESGDLYVDKTLFIKEFIDEGSEVNLITRPRRFGKTLNVSMLKYFFDYKNKEENEKLFNGLNISKEKELCDKHQNQYPVIFISLKDCKAKDWETCFKKKIKYLIQLMYEEHSYLKDMLSGIHLKAFNNILEDRAEDSDYDSALAKLIRYLKLASGKEVIVLIDEYDAPIQYAYSKDKEYFEEAIEFFREFLSSALKGQLGIYKALLTGILRVSKENMFSGLNNLKVITILDDLYADKFGFTEDEVKWLLKESKSKLTIEEIREWYNGYNIGGYQIYNPWSTCNAIKSNEIDYYWKNTSENQLLFEIMEESSSKSLALLEELKEDGSIAKNKVITQNTPLQDITTDETHLWTLLLFSGYLTTDGKINEKTYNLKVPNKEIQDVFVDFIKRISTKYIRDVSAIERGIYEKNYGKFEEGLNRKMLEVLSMFDIGVGKEYAYHTFMIGTLGMLINYEIVSNIERKEGRCDILMKEKEGDKIYIFEFKRAQKEEDMDRRCEEAMEQIDTRYSKGGEIKIGIAFYKKSAKVMVKEQDKVLFYRDKVN